MYINIYTRKIIISYLFLWGFSFTLYYISWFERVLNLWGVLILYSVILFLIYALWKFLHGREQAHFFLFFISFLYKVSASLAFLLIIVGCFTVYHNELRPAKFPLYTLSNGERTLQFQTVSHIASPSFYLTIRNAIIAAKKEGTVLFFEWVRPGSEENMEAFNNALGVNFSENLYENFSRLYGVVAQDNLLFLGYWETPDINVDMDIDTIIELYKVKKWEGSGTAPEREIIQVEDEILALLSVLTPRELSVLQYINQSFLNFFMKQEGLQAYLLEQTGTDIFSVILWERDAYIATFIHESEYDNMFALYGKLHFEWVLRELRLHDMKWEIQSVVYTQVIERSQDEILEQYMQVQNINLQERERLLRHIQSSSWD